MRYVFSALALSATLAAQYPGEPPVLVNPPAQTPLFGGPALGVNEVAQIGLMPLRDASGNVIPNQWYLTATVKTASPTFYQLWSGTYVPGRTPNEIVANSDVASLNNTTVDMFACNVSDDLLAVVCDTGGGTAPVIATRATPVGPFSNPQSIAAPVPAGYRDSNLFDKVGPNLYEYGYVVGRVLFKVVVNATTGATVGSPITVVDANLVTPAQDVHSHWGMRQWTGIPSEWGTCRALIHSKNDSSADSYFRSSLSDNTALPIPLFRIYDDASWKANPASIGGSTYWAYAPAAYGNPLQEDIVAMASATVPATGGALTRVGFAPPKPTPQIGIVMVGALGTAGLPIPGVTGNLGLSPVGLVFLPGLAVDPTYGEVVYNLVTGQLPRQKIDMQFLVFDGATSRILLGNTAQINPL